MKSFEKGLVWTTRLGVFCVPFIPLIVSASMFFPFITGKNFAFRIITEIIFAAWILLALRLPEFRPKRSYLLCALSAFLLVMLLADVFGANPFKSFWSNFERMEGYITLAHLFAYFLVASSVLSTERFWLRFFATSVGVSALLGFYGVLQLAGTIVINQGGVRLDGTFGNAAYFAGYMLSHFFLTLFLLARHRVSVAARWGYGVALSLQFFVLYFSATRGAAIGLTAGLFLSALLVAVLEKNNPRWRTLALGILVAVVVIAGALYTGKNSNFIRSNSTLSRFASISAKDAGPRFMVWGMAFQGFKEHPLLGWGQEGFNFVFNKYYNPNMWGQEQWFDRTHNVVFDWLIAGGLLGLLSYLLLFVISLSYLWRKKENEAGFTLVEKSILTGLLAAYFTHNFFVFDNLGSYLFFFSFLAFLHIRVAGKTLGGTKHYSLVSSTGGLSATATTLALVLISSLYFLNIKQIQTATDLIDALKPQVGGLAENLKAYERALARDSLARQEIAEQIAQTASSVIGSPQAPQELKNGFTSLAVVALENQIAKVPNDARHRFFLGMFLDRFGRFAEALPTLEAAHALSPQKQTIAFELANAYLGTGRGADALVLLKEAFESAPDFISARIIYAVVAISQKQFQLADELLTPLSGTPEAFDDRIIRAYYEARQYPKVLALWENRVKETPENPQFRISLAAAYFLNGNKARAIEVLQDVLKLKPEAKAEIEKYIADIRAGRNP